MNASPRKAASILSQIPSTSSLHYLRLRERVYKPLGDRNHYPTPLGDQNLNLYKDWDGDGTIDNPSDGYGLLENGGGQNQAQGYIPNTISHAQFAMQAPDATQNIIAQGEHVIISAQNMEERARELLDKTQQLNEIPFGPEMESLVSEIRALANDMLVGVDKNSDGMIDAVEGEGCADTVYESSYRMTDMPLLPGAGRIPEPAPTPQANP